MRFLYAWAFPIKCAHRRYENTQRATVNNTKTLTKIFKKPSSTMYKTYIEIFRPIEKCSQWHVWPEAVLPRTACAVSSVVEHHLMYNWVLAVRVYRCSSENLRPSVSPATSHTFLWISSSCTSCGKTMYLFSTPCHVPSHIFMTFCLSCALLQLLYTLCVCKEAMPSSTCTRDLPRDNLWVAFSPSLGCAGQHLQWLQPALLSQPSPEGSCRHGSGLLHSSN